MIKIPTDLLDDILLNVPRSAIRKAERLSSLVYSKTKVNYFDIIKYLIKEYDVKEVDIYNLLDVIYNISLLSVHHIPEIIESVVYVYNRIDKFDINEVETESLKRLSYYYPEVFAPIKNTEIDADIVKKAEYNSKEIIDRIKEIQNETDVNFVEIAETILNDYDIELKNILFILNTIYDINKRYPDKLKRIINSTMRLFKDAESVNENISKEILTLRVVDDINKA